ncbi:response regulator receiver protein [Dyadobacter sp. CY356]|uniref:response regulator receiver protein n=1 Tax=Dyadobacter sp. CY356 TaxID=2906442 RepID=UPI001F17DC9B|nr:response regulator receiver protein [Dyadobacter sp. CY356]MCF0056396.1 response regulator receiver protein [Dyadobacter sp. CY356]
METVKVNILAIGRHEEILETVLRIINKSENWTARGALTDEEAIALFEEEKFDIILLCGGIEEASEAVLRKTFTEKDPEIIVIQHYGGGSGLLSNEIIYALSQRNDLKNLNS